MHHPSQRRPLQLPDPRPDVRPDGLCVPGGEGIWLYNAHKLYLADKKEDLFSAGLWGLRMVFTTESARECVEVVRGHMGLSDYKPNVLTRGLYFRGVD